MSIFIGDLDPVKRRRVHFASIDPCIANEQSAAAQRTEIAGRPRCVAAMSRTLAMQGSIKECRTYSSTSRSTGILISRPAWLFRSFAFSRLVPECHTQENPISTLQCPVFFRRLFSSLQLLPDPPLNSTGPCSSPSSLTTAPCRRGRGASAKASIGGPGAVRPASQHPLGENGYTRSPEYSPIRSDCKQAETLGEGPEGEGSGFRDHSFTPGSSWFPGWGLGDRGNGQTE
jgi:hypothetical protein